MKSRILTCITAMMVAAPAVPVRLAAQANRDHNSKHHHYRLIDVGTFGGPNTYLFTQGVGVQNLSKRGIVTGSADTSVPDPNAPNCLNSDCLVSHAFQFENGVLTDLRALPGANSSYGSWISANGLVAGLSGNGEIDPLTGGPEARAVFWNDGQIVDLGTFGGNESLANAVNNRGQVVGLATNAIPDPFNTAPNLYGFGTQMHAFLWQNGVMRDLGTLGGPDSLALYVNEAGRVAGFSYINSIPDPIYGVPALHPFLWEKGNMRDLGTFGGLQVTDLTALNERDQVTGEMTLPGEQKSHPFLWDGKSLIDLGTFGGDHGGANWLNNEAEVVGHADYSIPCPGPVGGSIGHAFLWRKGAMRDLGTVPGINPLEGLSAAWGINSKTQIVGNSATCDFSVFDAFLWEKGSMTDLNTLVPSGSALHLFNAVYISDRGEITGFGFLPNGDVHTFLLIPCDENHSDSECEDEGESTGVMRGEANQRPNVVLPENVRRMLRRRLGSRYHIPGLGGSRD